MKVEVTVGIQAVIDSFYTVEIDTDTQDELKNLPFEKVRELIIDEGLLEEIEFSTNSFDGVFFQEFVEEEGKLIKARDEYQLFLYGVREGK
jgi:hypothetical protein